VQRKRPSCEGLFPRLNSLQKKKGVQTVETDRGCVREKGRLKLIAGTPPEREEMEEERRDGDGVHCVLPGRNLCSLFR